MSREQRRSQGTSSRRTPKKVNTDSGLPVLPLVIGGGVVLLVALLGYLIYQANSGSDELSADQQAEQDDSPDLPGVFHPSQGRGHFEGGLLGHQMTAFCEGVERSELADERSGVPFGETPSDAATSTQEPPTNTPTSTPSSTPTPASTGTSAGGSTTPNTTPTVPTDCYNSNPPSSGRHLGVQRNVDIGGGLVVNIPPDPDVYPHDVEIPRDAIPHILEHAGVYVGWNCAEGDQACLDTVQQVEDLVNQRIDNNDDRVVMSIYKDLPEGTIGLASWTRTMVFPYAEYVEDAVADFVGTHSCRFDPEGFCR
jgi:hypothetical protein